MSIQKKLLRALENPEQLALSRLRANQTVSRRKYGAPKLGRRKAPEETEEPREPQIAKKRRKDKPA